MTAHHSTFEAGGFTFDVAVTPRWVEDLRPTATEAERLAWHQAIALGVNPAVVHPFLVQPTIVAVRYDVSATTRRSWAEVHDVEWPSDTLVEATTSPDAGAVTLTCRATVEVAPGGDLAEEVGARLALEGPIGVEAAEALSAALVAS